jgi:hypothetical protein
MTYEKSLSWFNSFTVPDFDDSINYLCEKMLTQ